MSRIDEALRRAKGAAVVDVALPEPPADDAALWDFPEEQSAGSTVLQLVPAPPAVDPEDALEHLTAETVVAPAPVAATPIVAAPAAQPAAPAADPAPAPVATVAAAAVAPMAPVKPVLTAPEMLVTGTTRRDAVEQYRKLAATLYHVQANRGIRVVLCSSAAMSEGKTVTAANLALTLSQSYQRRVLLIDADLRRPRIHSLFNLPNRDGLCEALASPGDRKVNVVAVSPWLSVVTAGRPDPDPVHVLTSDRLSRVIADAGNNFDWVIIDTPPVLVLPDAGLLMALADAAVLVVGAGMTTYRMVKRAVDALGRDRIVGVVMNRAEDRVLEDGYGNYYGYYATADNAK